MESECPVACFQYNGGVAQPGDLRGFFPPAPYAAALPDAITSEFLRQASLWLPGTTALRVTPEMGRSFRSALAAPPIVKMLADSRTWMDATVLKRPHLGLQPGCGAAARLPAASDSGATIPFPRNRLSRIQEPTPKPAPPPQQGRLVWLRGNRLPAPAGGPAVPLPFSSAHLPQTGQPLDPHPPGPFSASQWTGLSHAPVQGRFALPRTRAAGLPGYAFEVIAEPARPAGATLREDGRRMERPLPPATRFVSCGVADLPACALLETAPKAASPAAHGRETGVEPIALAPQALEARCPALAEAAVPTWSWSEPLVHARVSEPEPAGSGYAAPSAARTVLPGPPPERMAGLSARAMCPAYGARALIAPEWEAAPLHAALSTRLPAAPVPPTAGVPAAFGLRPTRVEATMSAGRAPTFALEDSAPRMPLRTPPAPAFATEPQFPVASAPAALPGSFTPCGTAIRHAGAGATVSLRFSTCWTLRGTGSLAVSRIAPARPWITEPRAAAPAPPLPYGRGPDPILGCGRKVADLAITVPAPRECRISRDTGVAPVFPESNAGAAAPFERPEPDIRAIRAISPGPPRPHRPAAPPAPMSPVPPRVLLPGPGAAAQPDREAVLPAIPVRHRETFAAGVDPALPPFGAPFGPEATPKRGEGVSVYGGRWRSPATELRFAAFTLECPGSHFGVVLEMLRRRVPWKRL